MFKKLLIAVSALILGGSALEAKDVISLGIYFRGEGGVELTGELPPGISRGKLQQEKNDWRSYPCYIILDKIQNVELKFNVTSDGEFSVSLYPMRMTSEGNRVIPVKCTRFEVDGTTPRGIPGTIKKWQRIVDKKVKAGDVITIKAGFEKPDAPGAVSAAKPVGRADEAAVAVPAGQVGIANGVIAASYTDGVVTIISSKCAKPVATITTGLKTSDIKAESISCPEKNFHLLTLRSPEGSIAFKIESADASFAIDYNCNASPVTVKWDAAAVVIPDVFAEDEVVLPGHTAYKLPPFVPLYLGLLGKGDAALACIPIRAKSPAILSGDLKTLTINSKNNESYVFVLNAAPGAWHRTTLPSKPGEFKNLDEWQVPYPVLWRAAVPVDRDFIPLGNGSWSVWNIITLTGKGRPGNLPERATMVDQKTRRNWHGGFEGTYRYPAEFVDGKAKLMHPAFPSKIVHDLARPVFIYAWQPGKFGSSVVLPDRFLPPWTAANRLHRNTNSNYGMLATTCHITAEFEKLFYRDEAEKKINELARMLKSMQCFVENIRGRIESGREWRQEMLDFAAARKKLAPSLGPDARRLTDAVNEIDRSYQLSRERIKTPRDVERMSSEVLKLASAKLDAEAKEDRSKELGRAIRTVGGSQDSMVAHFRHVGKCIRRIALTEYMAAKSPAAAEFWGEVYRRTEALLQGYYCDGK